jgi:peroxiredoxin
VGWQIIALSPDRPAKVRESLEESEFPYLLVSDSEMNAAKAFGLAFTVDDKGFDRLKGYGIDIEAASGRDHRLLPVPGVFLVDETGTITFAHSDPNYKKRLSNKKILKAAGIE